VNGARQMLVQIPPSNRLLACAVIHMEAAETSKLSSQFDRTRVEVIGDDAQFFFAND